MECAGASSVPRAGASRMREAWQPSIHLSRPALHCTALHPPLCRYVRVPPLVHRPISLTPTFPGLSRVTPTIFQILPRTHVKLSHFLEAALPILLLGSRSERGRCDRGRGCIWVVEWVSLLCEWR
ncbi:hypothetical protein KC19_4G221500 [Ceratodon purpureus]|uniref:Uncharacterized protein n=1 Tax=Ceratodon purpureus TaxID=3225 RepID=A0A8T0IBE9_CERPU|nr:hypothetical protein KC19_4G221500 [Ceratodon purpureus]